MLRRLPDTRSRTQCSNTLHTFHAANDEMFRNEKKIKGKKLQRSVFTLQNRSAMMKSRKYSKQTAVALSREIHV